MQAAALVLCEFICIGLVACQESSHLIGEGVRALRTGQVGGAIEALTAAVEVDAENSRAHAYLANALHSAGDMEGTERHLLQAIELEPENMKLRANLGTMYVEWGGDHTEQGLATYREAIVLSGDPDGILKDNMGKAETLITLEHIKLELMARAAPGGQDEMGGANEYFDLEGLLMGSNYTHNGDIAWQWGMSTAAEAAAAAGSDIQNDGTPSKDSGLLFDEGLELLRKCVQREPSYAMAAHSLANALALLERSGAPEAELHRTADEAVRAVENTLELKGSAITSPTCGLDGSGQEKDGTACSLPAPGALHVVTVATHAKPQLQALQDSAERLGWEVTVLGLGEKWRGLGMKITLLQDYLKDVEGNDMILFVDAYDVVLLAGAATIVDEFLRMKSQVVIGAEVESAPDPGLDAVYEARGLLQGPLPFVNSGTYIGYAHAVGAMLDEILLDLEQHHCLNGAGPELLDDQRWFTRYFLRRGSSPERITLDRHGVLFQTLHAVNPRDIQVLEGGAVHSRLTGNNPAILHGNGSSLDLLQHIARKVDSYRK